MCVPAAHHTCNTHTHSRHKFTHTNSPLFGEHIRTRTQVASATCKKSSVPKVFSKAYKLLILICKCMSNTLPHRVAFIYTHARTHTRANRAFARKSAYVLHMNRGVYTIIHVVIHSEREYIHTYDEEYAAEEQ